MQLTNERRDEVIREIVNMLPTGLENESLKDEDLTPIANFVLERIDKFQTEDELIPFLSELAQKWSVFSTIHLQEKGKIIDKEEAHVAQNVLDLARGGKIDEAINLAKTTTEQQSQSQQ